MYELAKIQNVEGDYYDERIQALKEKLSEVDPTYFDILIKIQQMTSSKVHENAYDQWEASHVRLILASLKEALHEVYVVPAARDERRRAIEDLGQHLLKGSGS